MNAFDLAFDLVKGYQDLFDTGARLVNYGNLNPYDLENMLNSKEPITPDERLVRYALGDRGRIGNERFQYIVELPIDQAQEMIGTPSGERSRMRNSGWRGTKNRFEHALNMAAMAFGARSDGSSLHRQGTDEVFMPMFPSTIGSRLGGASRLPNPTRSIPRREIYSNYRDRMLPIVQQALENEAARGKKRVPVSGAVLSSLKHNNPSLGVVPGFEGHELGMAAALSVLQDTGRLNAHPTPEAFAMSRKLGRELGSKANVSLTPSYHGRGGVEIDLKEPTNLIDGPVARTDDVGMMANAILNRPDLVSELPFATSFGRRWK
jgi:hypothetical protein